MGQHRLFAQVAPPAQVRESASDPIRCAAGRPASLAARVLASNSRPYPADPRPRNPVSKAGCSAGELRAMKAGDGTVGSAQQGRQVLQSGDERRRSPGAAGVVDGPRSREHHLVVGSKSSHARSNRSPCWYCRSRRGCRDGDEPTASRTCCGFTPKWFAASASLIRVQPHQNGTRWKGREGEFLSQPAVVRCGPFSHGW
jgi:hypothetical protein